MSHKAPCGGITCNWTTFSFLGMTASWSLLVNEETNIYVKA